MRIINGIERIKDYETADQAVAGRVSGEEGLRTRQVEAGVK